MSRTAFTCALFAVAALLTGSATAAVRSKDRWNWSNNIEFTASFLEKPQTADELSKIVSQVKKGHVKVYGTAHSFNDIADTDGTHISTERLDQITVDPETHRVTFGAGITYTKLIEALQKSGRALLNVPSLPHLNVIGSVVTGTHGGGIENGAIATYVHEVAYVNDRGEQRRLTWPDPDLLPFLHSFGTLGIIYEMTMNTVEEYGVKKCIYKDVPWDTFLGDRESFDRLNVDKDFISFFTDWQEQKMNSIWTGHRYHGTTGYDEIKSQSYTEICDAEWFGGHLTERTHPVPLRSSDPCVTSGFGMWNKKIYHFEPDKPPSSDGDEIQSEFFVKYADLPGAVRDIYAQASRFRHLVQITEIRGVAADFIPLSPAKDEIVFGIHFTWKHDFQGIYEGASLIQDTLAKYDYRVHYGKFFHARPEVFKTFGDDLEKLKAKIDNQSQKFQNCWSKRVLLDQQICYDESNYERFADRMEDRRAQAAAQHGDEL